MYVDMASNMSIVYVKISNSMCKMRIMLYIMLGYVYDKRLYTWGWVVRIEFP